MKQPEWIWQKGDDWANFDYDPLALESIHTRFAFGNNGQLSGIVYVDKADQVKTHEDFQILVTGLEAYYTSEIEGVNYNADSLTASVRYQFDRIANSKSHDAKEGIAKMMALLFSTFDEPLSREMMDKWNACLTSGDRRLQKKGSYREHIEPMQVLTGACGKEKVDYEAPPSSQVPALMEDFIEWFNDTAPKGENPLPPITRAGLAHLHFVSIHPYEDGNGRISRALCEKALSQYLGKPTLISLSHAISNNKKDYYKTLQHAQKTGDAQPWLDYFGKMVLEAQVLTRQKLKSHIMISEIEKHPETGDNERILKFVKKLDKLTFEKNKRPGHLTTERYIKMVQSNTIICDETTAKEDLETLVRIGYLEKTQDDMWEFKPEKSYDTACTACVKKQKLGNEPTRAMRA